MGPFPCPGHATQTHYLSLRSLSFSTEHQLSSFFFARRPDERNSHGIRNSQSTPSDHRTPSRLDEHRIVRAIVFFINSHAPGQKLFPSFIAEISSSSCRVQ